MVDQFLGALKELERRSLDNIMIFSDVLVERLDDLATAMVNEKMSDNDYMKLLELYYQRCRKDRNRDGMMFCVLRIQQISYLKQVKKRPKPYPNIYFSDIYDDNSLCFLRQRRPFFSMLMDNLTKRLLWISLLISLFLFIVLVLGFQISFLVGFIVSVVLWIGMYLYCQKYLVYQFLDKEILRYRTSVNRLCRKIDDFLMN